MSTYIMVDTAIRKRTCHLCHGTISKNEKCLFIGGRVYPHYVHKNVCKACMSDILTDTPIRDRAERVRFHTNPNHRTMVLQTVEQPDPNHIVNQPRGVLPRPRRRPAVIAPIRLNMATARVRVVPREITAEEIRVEHEVEAREAPPLQAGPVEVTRYPHEPATIEQLLREENEIEF